MLNENEPIYFQWEVPEGGFRWIEPALEGQIGTPLRDESFKEVEQRQLVPAGEGDPVNWRETRPLDEEKALFRTFADLEPEENQILEFANQHGELDLYTDFRSVRPAGENPTRGSNLADWTERINEMKAVVQLWEAARSHDPKAFEGLIGIRDGELNVEASFLEIVRRRLEIWELPKPAPELDGFQKLVWTADELVKRIANRCFSPLGLDPRLDDGPSPDTLFLELVPTSLIGAMWLQFAYWTQGGRSFPECKQCGKRFAVALDAKRVVADYCSDTCRFKAYRIRKKKTLELKAKGKKNAEIASILGSDPKTVGKWIREAKAQEKAIRSRERAGSKRRSR